MARFVPRRGLAARRPLEGRYSVREDSDLRKQAVVAGSHARCLRGHPAICEGCRLKVEGSRAKRNNSRNDQSRKAHQALRQALRRWTRSISRSTRGRSSDFSAQTVPERARPCECSRVTFRPPPDAQKWLVATCLGSHYRAREHIGYMPEHVPLPHDMRVNEYLSFRAALKGVPGRRIKERLADVSDLCGLVRGGAQDDRERCRRASASGWGSPTR